MAAEADSGSQLGINAYQPRQPFIEFHNRPNRWAIMVCHRRAGKTVACVADLVLSALATTKQDARYAYLAPQYNQAKDIAWLYVKRLTADIPDVEYNESELRCDLPNGARIRLYGAENESRLRGLFLDGIILDEYADMSPSVWGEVIRPALADRKGWAAFIGTPKGHNAFYELWANAGEDWYRLMLKADASGLISSSELEAARKAMTEDQYEQEFNCSFEAAIRGAYYGKEMKLADDDGRITGVPYDKSADVITAWDLGIGDSTAIWFCQAVGKEIRLIDYYESFGVGLDHYVRVLREKPYLYREHLLPHDAEVRELGTGKTRVETLQSLGLSKIRIAPKLPIDDGISAVRLMISRCWFDAEKCKTGIEALKQYRTEYDEKRRAFSNRPLHDWTSHAADAFRYLATGFREVKKEQPIAYPPNGVV